MRDEQLREGLAAWLRPVQQAPVPDVSVIRRRLRRRRTRMAAAGTVLCALATGTAVLVGVTAAPAPTIQGPDRPGALICAGSNLRIGWAGVVKSNAISQELLPVTYLLEMRNAGRAACSLEGWPKLSFGAPRALRAVPVSYGTLITRPTREGSVSRVVEPTRIVLRPGARAAATITVTYPLAMSGVCARPKWSVTPPGGSTATLVPGPAEWLGTRRLGALLVCSRSTIVASPVYPAAVPATQNYPATAPRESPATGAFNPPAPGAGPQAAPYFLSLDGFRPHVVLVADWRTGKVTAVVRVPGIAAGVAAAGDDRTFVLAAYNGAVDRFYQLVLSQQGTQEGPLTLLPVPPVADPNPRFAVSGDGTELALAVPQPGGSVADNDEIMVVSLMTGSVRAWRSPDPGAVFGLSWANPGSPPGAAWARNNRLLFSWVEFTAGGRIARQRSGLRLLDTTAPGDNLLASRLVIPASVRAGGLTAPFSSPLINLAGTVVFATMTSHAHGNPEAAVVEFSATTGRPLGVVTPPAGESGMGAWCGALWADPSGGHALASCRVQGEINQGRFTRVDLHFPAGTSSHGTNFFAW